MRPTRFLAAAACAAALSPAGALRGQSIERRIVVGDGSRAVTLRGERADSDRAWLGISTGAGGGRDTVGLLVQEVVPGSPAEKAGLEEGARLASINGVSLRVAAADLDDPAMRAVVQRRLSRVMRDVKPGDEVELVAITDGRTRTVRARTIRASDAPSPMAREAGGGAALGVMLGGSPSRRDTMGVFVSGVVTDGPAEKAGIVEGDRIAAVNGQDVRVARDDAGDAAAAQAKSSRLQRVVRAAKPGDELELRVVTAGRGRTVKVKAGEARALLREPVEGPAPGDEDMDVLMFRPQGGGIRGGGLPGGGMIRMMPGPDGGPGREIEMRIEGAPMSELRDLDLAPLLEGQAPGNARIEIRRQLDGSGPGSAQGEGQRRVEVRVRRTTTI